MSPRDKPLRVSDKELDRLGLDPREFRELSFDEQEVVLRQAREDIEDLGILQRTKTKHDLISKSSSPLPHRCSPLHVSCHSVLVRRTTSVTSRSTGNERRQQERCH